MTWILTAIKTIAEKLLVQFYLLLTIRILEQKVQLNGADNFCLAHMFYPFQFSQKEENLQASQPSIVLSLQWIILQKQSDFPFHILNFYETIRYTKKVNFGCIGDDNK